MMQRWAVAALVIVVVAGSSSGQVGRASNDSIDAYVRREIAARGVPGADVASIDHGRVVLEKGYGIADVEAQSSVTAHSLFELASLTKQFTAACILMLAQEHKLGVDD